MQKFLETSWEGGSQLERMDDLLPPPHNELQQKSSDHTKPEEVA